MLVASQPPLPGLGDPLEKIRGLLRRIDHRVMPGSELVYKAGSGQTKMLVGRDHRLGRHLCFRRVSLGRGSHADLRPVPDTGGCHRRGARRLDGCALRFEAHDPVRHRGPAVRNARRRLDDARTAVFPALRCCGCGARLEVSLFCDAARKTACYPASRTLPAGADCAGPATSPAGDFTRAARDRRCASETFDSWPSIAGGW